ncbi:MAG: baseplate J/gp47 family protein [Acetobacter sp.]|jgi:uncharacterized phage protein gp47/JayE|nr:baseplate J/gp47 family protein [Acetobacter sp.]MCH4060532.1 baseplate J/gp47 family protein [Acetobacter sp.]MCH4087472.1 baseplate J/gp47 family protein [Acetobacter sp.]MCI1294673.1 baseplate J/gp47 family protein [Acetobacter sp.]MCI1321178.1 baseplate J/gp47 family protein [Acetobacter sp.]
MTAAIPTVSDLAQRFAAALLSRTFTAEDGSSVTLDANAPGSPEQVLSVVHAMALSEVYRYWRDFQLEMMVSTATETGLLPMHAQEWKTPRIPAQAAVGNILVTTSVSSVLPEGRTLTIDGSVSWEVSAETTLVAAKTTSVPVRATTAGTGGNVSAGVALTFVSAPAGVSQVVTDGNGLVGGAAIEDVATWRARILENIRNAPGGGTPSDYTRWAKNSGAYLVNVVGGWLGSGSVGIIVAMPGRVAPTAAQLATIQSYISDASRRVVRANATVVGAQIVTQPITLSIVPDTDANRSAVTAALTSWFAGTGIGATLSPSKIDSAIAGVSSVTDFELSVPLQPVALQQNQLANLGNITWLASS